MRPGGTIVEGTAGNTGIGLALVGNVRGYRTVIDPGDAEPGEDGHAAAGGRRSAPGAGSALQGPEQLCEAVRPAGRGAEPGEPNGAIWANQFDNVANRMGHYRTTGPEIWEQTGGKIDAFTCAIGTGGTLAGVGLFLKERRPAVRIVAADPMGAALYNWYKHGELKAEGSSISEGIGQGRVTANLEVLRRRRLPDHRRGGPALHLRPRRRGGLVLGASSAINIAGAVRVAKQLGRGTRS